jgi:magnesium transporter
MDRESSENQPLNTEKTDLFIRELAARIHEMSESEAVTLLLQETDEFIVKVLRLVVPNHVRDILEEFSDEQRENILAAASPENRRQWAKHEQYPENSVGNIMEIPIGVLSEGISVSEAVEKLRKLVKKAFITYGFVIDRQGRLLGVITMRDLLFGKPDSSIDEIMIRNPFSLLPETELVDAMKQVLHQHFPVYPVCEESGKLVGLVRGQAMFEQQAIVLSAQPGSMVGVEKEEHFSTPWLKSLRYRHPWLQLNLLTAFVAAAVVGIFQDTIDRIVVLAVFLPVLAGQSGNTGCQALAIAIRGMTLGELKSGKEHMLIAKEGLLGMLNGTLVGLVASVVMYVVATLQNNPEALLLSVVVLLAMIGSCIISGIAGVLIPMVLRRIGADPATASSIFLTTATDVASMGIFLWLATWLAL